MAVDFLAMLNEQKKKQEKEAQKASKESKKKASTNTPKKEKTPVIKATAPKKETFEEQFEKADPQTRAIIKYLVLKFPDIKEKMNGPDVSIEGMNKYIQSQARKNAKNGMLITVPQELIETFPEEAKKEGWLSDSAVYGWGRHYYDENGNVA